MFTNGTGKTPQMEMTFVVIPEHETLWKCLLLLNQKPLSLETPKIRIIFIVGFYGCET
jgi:hypothetical protein